MAEGITYPVVVDADHVVTELYAISNVPTVVLINEDDTIAMPNWSAYGSDLFSEFTGVDSAGSTIGSVAGSARAMQGCRRLRRSVWLAISPARKKPPVSTSASHLRCAIGAIKRAATETSTGPQNLP